MKNIITTFLLLFCLSISAQETAIKQSISTFFEGLQTSDTLKIQSVCHKEMKLQSIMVKNAVGKLSFETNSAFYKSIGSIPKNIKIEERILSYNIQIDGSMAQVWAPYEFYIDGKLSHIGTNSFTLLLENNSEASAWKIIHIIDTRKK